VHWLLYAGMVLAPVSGLLHHAASTGFAPIWWPFGQDLPFIPKNEELAHLFGLGHFVAAAMIGLALIGHIGGALKHAVIDRDQTLRRMTAGRSAVITAPAHALKRSNAMAGPLLAAIILMAGGAGAVFAWDIYMERTTPALAAGDVVDDEPQSELGTAPAWQVDHAQSTLAITVSQLGSPVDGVFENWSADIRFDPDALAQSSVRVVIETGSLTIGTVSSQATGADFLAASQYPRAIYEVTAFKALGEGGYEAMGRLTLHGQTEPHTLPFTLDIDGDTARMSAQTTLNRITYGVGAKAHPSEESVGFEVAVTIDLLATRQ
jgi:polyisoprenoid-binding protein YceI